MKKPASLRAMLSGAIPSLAQNPENLIIFVDDGTLRTRRTGSEENLSFAFAYDLKLLVKDFNGDPEQVFALVVDWLKTNQQEIISNPDKQNGLKFEIEYLTHETLDILISLKLTEDVKVIKTATGITTEVIPEPDSSWIMGYKP